MTLQKRIGGIMALTDKNARSDPLVQEYDIMQLMKIIVALTTYQGKLQNVFPHETCLKGCMFQPLIISRGRGS